MKKSIKSNKLILVLSIMLLLISTSVTSTLAMELSLTPTKISVTSIIIDNSDPEFTTDSDWVTSTSTKGFYGADYLHDGNKNSDPNKWAKWTPNIQVAGNYNIYMRWTANINRPSSVPIEIKYSGGLNSSITINQEENGGMWVYIGSYYLSEGNDNYVKLLASGSGFTIADSVMFEYMDDVPTFNEIVLDNSDPGFSTDSRWGYSTLIEGYYGSNYRHDTTKEADINRWAKWTPNIQISGNYNIYMSWPSNINRPNAAPLEIKYSDGIDSSKTVNQQVNGDRWVYIGTYHLSIGLDNYVKLLASCPGYTIADVVRFELIDDIPIVSPTVEPTATPEPTIEPTVEPTATLEPTIEPTVEPTATPEPTIEPTVEPTATLEPTIEPTVEPTATPAVGNGLKAEYFDNMDFTDLKVTRLDKVIDFNWGQLSPDVSINPDSYSARWTGQIQPAYSGEYTFYVASDDGTRLWVDNQLVIDLWRDHSLLERSGKITLTAGKKYDIKLEYYENKGLSAVTLKWSSDIQEKAIIPSSCLYSEISSNEVSATGNGLKAEYYDNINFTGLKAIENVPKIDFNWGVGSAHPAISSNTFSIRYSGKLEASNTEEYTFYSLSDDGFRVWLDGKLVIDHWSNHTASEKSSKVFLTEGKKYDIVVEYYDNYANAVAKLMWESSSRTKEVIPMKYLYN